MKYTMMDRITRNLFGLFLLVLIMVVYTVFSEVIAIGAVAYFVGIAIYEADIRV